MKDEIDTMHYLGGNEKGAEGTLVVRGGNMAWYWGK